MAILDHGRGKLAMIVTFYNSLAGKFFLIYVTGKAKTYHNALPF